MFEKLLAKLGYSGRDKLKQRLADTDLAPDYNRSNTQFFDELIVQDLPVFTLRTALLMMFDPIVQIAMQMRDAALMPGEINVESNHPQAKKFIETQWQKLWTLHAPKIIKTKLFGFGGFQPKYKLNLRTNYLEVASLKSYAPHDTRALRDKDVGEVVGFNLRRTGAAGITPMFRPKALWCTFDAMWGASYGQAIQKRAYGPWYEKWMRHGAKKVQQLRMLKDSYVGDILYYPHGQYVTDANGNAITWRDLARELGENRLAGGVMTLPMLLDKNGQKIVEYQGPQDTGNPEGIFRWVEGLDNDICKALGVPPEVIQASETGSGFSGRSIPMAAFLQGCMVEFGDYVQAIDHYMLKPLLWLNFGTEVECTVTPKPLIETFTADIGGSGVGGGAMGQPQQQQPAQQPPRIENKPPENKPVDRGPQQFREDESSDGTRWITIGGKKGAEGAEHKGGFPVQISSNGTILKGGPKELRGKNLKDIGKHFDDLNRRQRQQRAYASIGDSEAYAAQREEEERNPIGKTKSLKAVHSYQSEKWGMSSEDYEAASDDVWNEHIQFTQEREDAKKYARKRLGLNAGNIKKLEDSGHDFASNRKSLKGIDTVGREIASMYPILGWGKGYDSDTNYSDDRPYDELVWELVKEGSTPAPSKLSREFHEAVDRHLQGSWRKSSASDFNKDVDWKAVEFAEDAVWVPKQFDEPNPLETDPIASIANKGASKASQRVREAAAAIREAVKKK